MADGGFPENDYRKVAEASLRVCLKKSAIRTHGKVEPDGTVVDDMHIRYVIPYGDLRAVQNAGVMAELGIIEPDKWAWDYSKLEAAAKVVWAIKDLFARMEAYRWN